MGKGSLITSCLLLALLASPVRAGQDASGPQGVLALPCNSAAQVQNVVEIGILRFVCARGYAGFDNARPVPCPGSVAGDDTRLTWRFTKKDGAGGAVQDLRLWAVHSPAGRYELYLTGTVADDGGETLNPDLDALTSDFQGLLDELAAAAPGKPNDGILPYQLSYIQADRAIAILKTLGYPVIEYKNAVQQNGGAAVQVGMERLFAEERSGDPMKRPLIIKLIDSESTSLVNGNESITGGRSTELTGGQELKHVTDGTPQQRLLIVHDRTDHPSLDLLLDRLQTLIDIPARQLLIEAIVIELEDNQLLDLGLNLRGGQNGYDFSLDGAGASSLTFTRPHPATLFDLMATLRALEDRGRAKVLSRPSILVLDGRQARINVGDNIPYTNNLSVSNGVVVNSTDFLKTGIILNLRPRASFDNSEVTFQVETIISSPGPSRVLPDGVLVAPTVQSRQVQTLVRVANDTPFVIGGLIDQNDQKNTTGLPWLSRIPFLGGKYNTSKDRREVIVVITPHIITAQDSTFSYSIPKDAQGGGTDRAGDRLQRRSLSSRDAGDRCKVGDAGVVFKPQVQSADKPEKGSIFDTLDSQLFRNVYRLRSSDIFDLRFIKEDPRVQRDIQGVQELAQKVTEAEFTGRPRVDPAILEREVKERLEHEFCQDPRVPKSACLPAELEETFLTLFDGAAPGEEVFVYEMMIRILERLGMSSFVLPDKMIFFERGKDGVLDLTGDDEIRNCLEEGKTAALSFLKEDDPQLVDGFKRQCLRDNVSIPSASAEFSPPSVRLFCVSSDVPYRERLRDCNQWWDGKWLWQTILLNRTYCGSRSRNPMALLQGVLALERLLDLNDSATFPRTLQAFHVGRELVLPTRESLEARRHLIGLRTAELFYETLDYYHAFEQIYSDKTNRLEKRQLELKRKHNVPAPPQEPLGSRGGLTQVNGQEIPEVGEPAPDDPQEVERREEHPPSSPPEG
jgi:hypothetical protein